jgi:exopolysaccharide production protein ExoQ
MRAASSFLLMHGYFLLSLGWSIDRGIALRRDILDVLQLLVFIGLIAGLRPAHKLHVTLAAVAIWIAVLNAGAGVVMPGFTNTEDGFAGVFSNKNVAGPAFAMLSLAAASAIPLASSRGFRLALGGAVLLLFGMVIMSRSTTSQAVCVVGLSLLPAVTIMRRWKMKTVLAVIMPLPCLALFIVFLHLIIAGPSGTDILGPLRDATFSDRVDIWSFVVDEIEKRPMFGSGYGTFWSISPGIQPSLKRDEWFSIGTVVINEGHNGYLDTLATTGIIGLAFAVLVIGHTLVRALSALRRSPDAGESRRGGVLARATAIFYFVMITVFLVHNMMETDFFAGESLFASMFALATFDLAKNVIAERARRDGTPRYVLRRASPEELLDDGLATRSRPPSNRFA